MIIGILVGVVIAAVGYAIYKHVGLATIEADVKAAVSNPTATLATIKAELAKYL
jgi:hypothetical protein